MAYKKGSGAKAVAGYGASTRDVTATEKMWGGIESLWGSAQDIGTSIALKKGEADTAWEEYETGYEALAEPVRAAGGDVAAIPKRGGFWKQLGQTLMPGGDKGFFQMPEGEVQIDDRMYDMEKIQGAGSFLASNAAAILDEGARGKYLERTVPGRDIPSYARGGDFITNGPQEILVGDNPGGRERVTVKPLSSKNDDEYKKRNWLESLYENNRKRKVY